MTGPIIPDDEPGLPPRIVRTGIAALLVLLGIAGFVILVKTKPEANRGTRPDRGTLVQATTIEASNHSLTVRVQGAVVAARQVELRPEVSGRIIWQNDQLAAGGRLRAGDLIVRIDPRDYKLALEQQRAAVNRAQLDLEIERGRGKIAEREWQLMGDEKGASADGSLALRGPQLRTARVGVDSARSSLERAELYLGRTAIRAPFNAFVKEEAADLGQLVTPQSKLGVLVGTDQFWVQVSVPVEHLPRIALPQPDGTGGARARVRMDAGEAQVERQGRVIRLLGDLDPIGRMARLIVAIDDPLAVVAPVTIDDPAASGEGPQDKRAALPLLLGSYVHVEIEGAELTDAIEIPRVALREGDRVYLISGDNTLRIQPVRVVWRREKTVLVGSGVGPGDRLIVSRVPTPVPGMKLRTESVDPAAEPKVTGDKTKVRDAADALAEVNDGERMPVGTAPATDTEPSDPAPDAASNARTPTRGQDAP